MICPVRGSSRLGSRRAAFLFPRRSRPAFGAGQPRSRLTSRAPRHRPRRLAMTRHQGLQVEIDDPPLDHPPCAADHDPVGTMGAAQHEGGQWISRPRKARLVQLEEGQVGLPAGCDPPRRRRGRGRPPSRRSPSAARPHGRPGPRRSAGAAPVAPGAPPASGSMHPRTRSRPRRGRSAPRPPPDPRPGTAPRRAPCWSRGSGPRRSRRVPGVRSLPA